MSRNKKIAAVALILALSPFLNSGAADSKSKPIPADKVAKLAELRTKIRGWAPICPDGTLTDTPGECPFGDMTIFSGLSCLSGEKERCEDVRRAQAPSGEWFRSPGLVDADYHNGTATFSRDQSRGVLSYLIVTKDTAAATRWMDFVEKNDWKLCQKSEKGWDRCATRAMFWTTTALVWDYLGLKRVKKMKDFNFAMQAVYQPIEASVQPNDYPMHLTAASIYIRQEMAKRSGKAIQQPKHVDRILNILTRRAPENPFFHYLKHGADETAADTVLKYCPEKEPKLSIRRDWAWQRSIDHRHDGMKERTWEVPGGHDCIFMINLLIGPEAEKG